MKCSWTENINTITISDLQVFNKPWGTFDPINNLAHYKSVHFGPVPSSSSYEIYTETKGTPTLDPPTRAAITHYTFQKQTMQPLHLGQGKNVHWWRGV